MRIFCDSRCERRYVLIFDAAGSFRDSTILMLRSAQLSSERVRRGQVEKDGLSRLRTFVARSTWVRRDLAISVPDGTHRRRNYSLRLLVGLALRAKSGHKFLRVDKVLGFTLLLMQPLAKARRNSRFCRVHDEASDPFGSPDLAPCATTIAPDHRSWRRSESRRSLPARKPIAQ